jgi:hypothetical protein
LNSSRSSLCSFILLGYTLGRIRAKPRRWNNRWHWRTPRVIL